MELTALPESKRLSLIQMACVAAWADIEIADEERAVIRALATKLELGEGQLRLVEKWLTTPPPDFDPYQIPAKHRQLFLDAFIAVIEADGRIDPEESESIQLLRELVS